ncbi:hypothetical protein [Photobacterium damselae]|uniref:hypothetical protein n=1 Tax=Photobacterium damselae TaxID=38293 RepID=UPI000D662230|nr:hypothetical protein [Photobacterium damselae]AWK84443.1 hypothetical protein BST98_20635 [Photobacterium damselae]
MAINVVNGSTIIFTDTDLPEAIAVFLSKAFDVASVVISARTDPSSSIAIFPFVSSTNGFRTS